MEEKVTRYIQHHTLLLTSAVLVVFVLLAAGEYFLYRQILHVNSMVSEGFMQIKEMQNDTNPAESVPPSEALPSSTMPSQGQMPGQPR